MKDIKQKAKALQKKLKDAKSVVVKEAETEARRIKKQIDKIKNK